MNWQAQNRKKSRKKAQGGLSQSRQESPASTEKPMGGLSQYAAGGGVKIETPGADQVLAESTSPTLSRLMANNRVENQMDGATGHIKPKVIEPSAGGESTTAGLTKSIEQAKSEKEQIMNSAIERLQQRKTEGFSATDKLKLGAALLRPTRTGRFGEGLGNAVGALAEISGGRDSIDDQIATLGLKKADLNSESLKSIADLRRATAANSKSGKEALDEGLEAGTPEFHARVAELNNAALKNKSQARAGMAEGADLQQAIAGGGYFEVDKTGKSTGNWVRIDKDGKTQGVIASSIVKKDDESIDYSIKLKGMINTISLSDVRKARSSLDLTQGGTMLGSFIGSNFAGEAAAAQGRLKGASMVEALNNLPPGVATDRDILEAKSSIPKPGATEKQWTDWITLVNRGLDRFAGTMEKKYGGPGVNPLIADLKGKSNFELERETELARRKEKAEGKTGSSQTAPANAAQPSAPNPIPTAGQKVGNFIFSGGDPADPKNYTR